VLADFIGSTCQWPDQREDESEPTDNGGNIMALRFKGIFTPLTTPFFRDRIHLGKLEENIRSYNSLDLSGFLVLGSTGENVYLSDEESEEIVKTAKRAAAPGKIILAGTARESTKVTLEFTRRMAAAGADAALVRTPSYFKALMDGKALKKHYWTLADHSEIPIIIYHIPRNTGLSVSVDLIASLSSHPNITGIKDSSGNLAFLGEALPCLDSHFDYLLGAASVFLPGLIMGGSGGIITLSGIAPRLCLRLYELFLKKDWSKAVKLQRKLIPLNRAIIERFGIPAVKYALDKLGYYGGPCRPPLRSLHKPGRREMDSILDKLDLL
jgi:4-hydroxy-2-oxoglutarate aldolase